MGYGGEEGGRGRGERGEGKGGMACDRERERVCWMAGAVQKHVTPGTNAKGRGGPWAGAVYDPGRMW